jgi:hypothetical protein
MTRTKGNGAITRPLKWHGGKNYQAEDYVEKLVAVAEGGGGLEVYTHEEQSLKDMPANSACCHEVSACTAGQLAEQIRADGVDILFDLVSLANPLLRQVFAHKTAPPQISWFDYPLHFLEKRGFDE